MNKLTIKLKQHTPIIHFQHNQDGATLRTTEVKPKLDRFILNKLGEGNYEKGKTKAKENGWLVGKGEHGALDYKMRIGGEKETTYLLKSFVSRNERDRLSGTDYIDDIPVFGDDMYGVELTNNCLNILSFKEGVSECILKYICEFFSITNFGFRQSKGFGSFTVQEIIDNVKNENKDIDKDYLKMIQNNFKYVYQKGKANFTDQLKLVNKDYKTIKAGVNHGVYIKSYLFCYHKKNGIGWEKKVIKRKMEDNEIIPFNNNNGYNQDRSCRRCKTNDSANNNKFVRALLGLAEHYEFNRTTVNVKISGGDDFQRFQSPITFKLIDDTIFLLGNPIQEDIFSKPFSFQLYEKNHNGTKTSVGAPFTITTPDSFNLKEFLELCSSNLKYIKKQSL